MENEKYYLISYSFEDFERGLFNAMILTEEDPIDWILGSVAFERGRNKKDFKRCYNFVLLNYWELTKEQYHRMKDEMQTVNNLVT